MMIKTCVRTLLLLFVAFVLSGTTQVQAEVYGPPGDFGWRKSVPLHFMLLATDASNLNMVMLHKFNEKADHPRRRYLYNHARNRQSAIAIGRYRSVFGG